MLSIFASRGSMVEEAALKKWLDYIAKDKASLGIQAVAIVYDNGNVAAATSKFKMTTNDFKELKKMYSCTDAEQISYGGVTYCLKGRGPTQFVCFNGRNYLVVSKTELTFVVATCQNKHKCALAAEWLDKVAKKLRERRK